MRIKSLTITLIALALSTGPALANPNDLPTGMHSVEAVDQAIGRAVGGPATGHDCTHHTGEAGGTHHGGRGFYAESRCAYACRGQGAPAPGSVTRDAPFNPQELGLRNGDGNFPYASLSAHLSNFASQTCLEAATVACGGLEKVDTYDFQGMSSGRWSMPDRLTCESSQPMVPSPFDAGYNTPGGLRTAPLDPARGSARSPIPRISATGRFVNEPARTAPASQRFRPVVPPPTVADVLMPGESEEEAREFVSEVMQSYVDASECRSVVRARVCYGNCVCYTSGNRAEADCPRNNALRLASNRENAYSEVPICADALTSEIKRLRLGRSSDAVLKHYCEDFATRTLTSGSHSIATSATVGNSCAAYRGSFDCAGWIGGIRAAR